MDSVEPALRATDHVHVDFDDGDMANHLDRLPATGLDELDFGVIGFDVAGNVQVYNRHESAAAGLAPPRVLGRHLFTEVAPCMNNFMVAQRYADAATQGVLLDVTIDYVLTLRMRPTRVALRLLADPRQRLRYVLIRRRGAA